MTKSSIRDARLKEIRIEILKSEKLKSYFEENPNDLNVLRHDTALRPRKIQRHMKNVPSYLSEFYICRKSLIFLMFSLKFQPL